MVSIYWIIVLVVMLILILVIGLEIWHLSAELSACETTESPFCPVIKCPCDSETTGPCNGYAIRPGADDGTFYCSNAQYTLVTSS